MSNLLKAGVSRGGRREIGQDRQGKDIDTAILAAIFNRLS